MNVNDAVTTTSYVDKGGQRDKREMEVDKKIKDEKSNCEIIVAQRDRNSGGGCEWAVACKHARQGTSTYISYVCVCRWMAAHGVALFGSGVEVIYSHINRVDWLLRSRRRPIGVRETAPRPNATTLFFYSTTLC